MQINISYLSNICVICFKNNSNMPLCKDEKSLKMNDDSISYFWSPLTSHNSTSVFTVRLPTSTPFTSNSRILKDGHKRQPYEVLCQ